MKKLTTALLATMFVFGSATAFGQEQKEPSTKTKKSAVAKDPAGKKNAKKKAAQKSQTTRK